MRDAENCATLQDPVAAYDRIAASFPRLSEQRRAYLDRVERLVISAIPAHSRSLLDIGAGEGSRACRIAQAAGLEQTVLLEPSAPMRKSWPAGVVEWAIRAEDLRERQGQFDAITCLWNVLGHIFPEAARCEVLRQSKRLLAPGGRIFIDVNHRYNLRHYGLMRTALRFLRDHIWPDRRGGDVVVTWETDRGPCQTRGHVFTGGEFSRLCRTAGLTIERRYVVDYATGAVRKCSFAGNLLYVLRA